MAECLDDIERVMREHEPSARTNNRKRQRFDEQLREDPAATRAERAAHGDLAETRDRSGIDENREVDRDDERQGPDEQLSEPERPEECRILMSLCS